MSTWLRLFAHNLYDWTVVHPETGVALLIVCLAVSISFYIGTRNWRNK